MTRTTLFFFFAVLTACGTAVSPPSDNRSEGAFKHLKVVGLDLPASRMATYLQLINYPDVQTVQGNNLRERQDSKNQLIHSYATSLASRGITPPKLLAIAGNNESVAPILDRMFSGPVRFEDHMSLSEIVVLAVVGDPVADVPLSWAGPGAYNLKIKEQIKGIPPRRPVAIMNARSSHDRRISTGMECVFFLSPTLTKYRKAFPIGGLVKYRSPDAIMSESFESYCTEGDNVFVLQTYIAGRDSITREEILSLILSNESKLEE